MKILLKTLTVLGFLSTFCLGAELLVRTDVECRLSVDGKTRGTLKAADGIRLSLSPGEHEIEASPLRGSGRWQKTIKLAAADDHQVLSIPLLAAVANPGPWVDPDTHLMWAAADNGLGLSRNQAVRYCRQLTLGGFMDWKLPSIDELQGIFGGAGTQTGYHVRGPVKLTGWQWSSTPGKQEGENWAFDFGDGGRASVPAGDSGLNRALCVRHTSE